MFIFRCVAESWRGVDFFKTQQPTSKRIGKCFAVYVFFHFFTLHQILILLRYLKKWGTKIYVRKNTLESFLGRQQLRIWRKNLTWFSVFLSDLKKIKLLPPTQNLGPSTKNHNYQSMINILHRFLRILFWGAGSSGSFSLMQVIISVILAIAAAKLYSMYF